MTQDGYTLLAGSFDDEHVAVQTPFDGWGGYNPAARFYRVAVRSRSTGMMVWTILEAVAAPVVVAEAPAE